MDFATAFPQAALWVEELEDAVADAERGLRARDWKMLDEANKRQPRLIHGLRNALEAERPGATSECNTMMDERIDQIVAVRASQIERLTTFREDVKNRLVELAHFRKVAREASAKRLQPSTFNVSR